MDENDILIRGDGVVFQKTGELVKPEDFIEGRLEDAKQSLLEACEIADEYGISFRAKIISRKTGTHIRAYIKNDNKYLFNKVFQASTQSLFKQKLNVWSKAFIAQFVNYLNFPYNYILIDNKHPTVDEYSEMMGIKKNKMIEIFKELA